MMQKYQHASGYFCLNGTITVKKLHGSADIPFKENDFDVTWELSVIGREDNRAEDVFQDVNVYNTGLSVSVPKNYHLEVIEHPQLWKAGYSLVGGPRIINPEDDSEIQIPLFKYKECEDLELPFRAATVILRQSEYMTMAPEVTPANKKGYSNTKTNQHQDEDILGGGTTTKKKKGTRGKRTGNIF